MSDSEFSAGFNDALAGLEMTDLRSEKYLIGFLAGLAELKLEADAAIRKICKNEFISPIPTRKSRTRPYLVQ